MAAVKGIAVAVLLVLAVSSALSSASASASSSIAGRDHMQLGIFSSGAGGRGECRGTVGECGAGVGEDVNGEDAEGELHRRVLAGGGYISYGALRRGTVPCSRRGASYYNCRPGAQANPYHRGCSRITRCRG